MKIATQIKNLQTKKGKVYPLKKCDIEGCDYKFMVGKRGVPYAKKYCPTHDDEMRRKRINSYYYKKKLVKGKG